MTNGRIYDDDAESGFDGDARVTREYIIRDETRGETRRTMYILCSRVSAVSGDDLASVGRGRVYYNTS